MASAADWRDEIEVAINKTKPYLSKDGDIFPGEWHAYDELYPEFMEAVVQVESQGSPDIVSGAGAVGLGQIVPDGQEAYWFEELTDRLGDRVEVTEGKLKEPWFNLNVMAVGLSARYAQAQDITHSKDDQFLAAALYFGCDVQANGAVDPNCGDGLNTWGNPGGYRDQLESYIRTNYGDAKVKEIGNTPGVDPNGKADGVVDEVKDKVTTVADFLADPSKWLPVVAIVLGGAVLVLAGGAALVRG